MSQYKTALQNLEAARKLIRPFRRWTTNDLAIKNVEKDEFGNLTGVSCSPKNKHAEAFCALGAVKHVNGPGEKKALNLLRIAALQIAVAEGEADPTDKPNNDHVIRINDVDQDKETHRNVLALFRRAIRLAKKA
jgi:hypothetical protein